MKNYQEIINKIKKEQNCNHSCCICSPGPRGPAGPPGRDGTSVTIDGTYNSYEELINEHPQGKPNESYLVKGDLYVWSENDNTWKNVGRIAGPTGPKGDKGDQGTAGPLLIRSAYLITFNGETSIKGVEVESNTQLPITRIELDPTNLNTLVNSNKQIKFNIIGHYKITFITSAYVEKIQEEFNPDNDFITIGFKQTNTDNVYIGASKWIQNEIATQIIGHGIITVENTNNTYELDNLGKKTIYLTTPDIKNIASASYFTNPLVTITIEYLGRQNI